MPYKKKKEYSEIRKTDIVSWNPITDRYAPWEAGAEKQKICYPKICDTEIQIIRDHLPLTVKETREILRERGYHRAPETISKIRNKMLMKQKNLK